MVVSASDLDSTVLENVAPYAEDDDFGIILLGSVSVAGTLEPVENSVYLYDPRDDSLVDVSEYYDGEIPSREDFSVAKVGPNLYLFGGRANDVAQNDLWNINLLTRSVALVSTTNLPTPRWGHNSIVTHNNEGILVFGGKNSDTYFNSVHQFNLSSSVWITESVGDSSSFLSARAYFGLGSINKGYFLFGGQNSTSSVVDVGILYLNYEDVPPFELKIMAIVPYRIENMHFLEVSNVECIEIEDRKNCSVLHKESLEATDKYSYSNFFQSEGNDTIWVPYGPRYNLEVTNLTKPVQFPFYDSERLLFFGGRHLKESAEMNDKAYIMTFVSSNIPDILLSFSPFSLSTKLAYHTGHTVPSTDALTSIIDPPEEVLGTGITLFGELQVEDNPIALTNEAYLIYIVPIGEIVGFKMLQIPVATKPSPRKHHSSTLVGSKVYIFGGQDQDDSYLNDFWIFDTETLEYTRIASPDEELFPEPSPRIGHSLTALSNQEAIVLHGGYDGESYLSDVWKYNFTLGYWRKYEDENIPPRAFHGAFATQKETSVMIFGGYNADGPVDLFLPINFHIILYKPELPKPPNMNTPFEIDEVGGNRATPNYIVAGVAGGLFGILLVVVIVLSLVRRR